MIIFIIIVAVFIIYCFSKDMVKTALLVGTISSIILIKNNFDEFLPKMYEKLEDRLVNKMVVKNYLLRRHKGLNFQDAVRLANADNIGKRIVNKRYIYPREPAMHSCAYTPLHFNDTYMNDIFQRSWPLRKPIVRPNLEKQFTEELDWGEFNWIANSEY